MSAVTARMAVAEKARSMAATLGSPCSNNDLGFSPFLAGS